MDIKKVLEQDRQSIRNGFQEVIRRIKTLDNKQELQLQVLCADMGYVRFRTDIGYVGYEEIRVNKIDNFIEITGVVQTL